MHECTHRLKVPDLRGIVVHQVDQRQVRERCKLGKGFKVETLNNDRDLVLTVGNVAETVAIEGVE